MEYSAAANDIVKMEKGFWEAMCNDDLESLLDMTDFPCVLADSRGTRVYGKEEFSRMFEQARGKMKDFEFDDGSIEVRQITPDAAVIAYKVKNTFVDNGEAKVFNAVDTSTWVKKDGQWKCSMHAEILVQ